MDASTDPAEFPSGEWVGYYQENGSNHRQEMHLCFRDGRVTGAGADAVGRFAIRGGYDSVSREAWWTKSYDGAHTVSYRGYRELRGIWGLWEIPRVASDGFHIWPRELGEAPAAGARAGLPEPAPVGC